MLGGLSLRYRALIATAALMGSFAGEPVNAADLGGDCCADLEDRVAELEATTVRKGNKKVTVELYGRVNRVVNFWDDGAERNVYVENMAYSTTRFGLRGKAKTGLSDVNAIYVIEMEQFADQSRFANQFNDNPDVNTQLRVRKSAIGLDSKKYGKIWLGLQEMAKDNINKDTVVIKGLDQTMTQDFYMNWTFFLRQKGFNNAEAFSSSTPTFRDIARCYSTSSSAFDCSTRRNEVRYDTPDLYGFVASASWGEDDIWSASVRYQKEWDNWKVGAGYAYEDFTDELVQNGGGGVFFQGFKRRMKEWAGSASIIHKPTGLGPATATPKTTTSAPRACTPARPRRSCTLGTSPAASARPSLLLARPPSGAATPKTRMVSAASPAPRSPHRSRARRPPTRYGTARSPRAPSPASRSRPRSRPPRPPNGISPSIRPSTRRPSISTGLPAHRAGDQAGHARSVIFSDRHAQECAHYARRFRRVLHGRPHPVLSI